jgi:hypothetical protein
MFCPECEFTLDSPECHAAHGCGACEFHWRACWEDSPGNDAPRPKDWFDSPEFLEEARTFLASL